jgi:hypothetical protein
VFHPKVRIPNNWEQQHRPFWYTSTRKGNIQEAKCSKGENPISQFGLRDPSLEKFLDNHVDRRTGFKTQGTMFHLSHTSYQENIITQGVKDLLFIACVSLI